MKYIILYYIYNISHSCCYYSSSTIRRSIPLILKNPNGTVTLVVAKPTGATSSGPFCLPMVCAFCDTTASMAMNTWAQKHDTGQNRHCFFSNNFTKELNASNLTQFTVGKYNGWEYLPISNLQGWQPCVTHPTGTVPAAAAVDLFLQPPVHQL